MKEIVESWLVYGNNIRSNLLVAQNGRLIMNPVYNGTMVYAGWKTLDFRLSEIPQNELSRTFSISKLSLESCILYPLRKNFREYPHDITIRISVIVYSSPQYFSWFKNYKMYWLSILFLALVTCGKTLCGLVDTDVLLMMNMVSESNART